MTNNITCSTSHFKSKKTEPDKKIKPFAASEKDTNTPGQLDKSFYTGYIHSGQPEREKMTGNTENTGAPQKNRLCCKITKSAAFFAKERGAQSSVAFFAKNKWHVNLRYGFDSGCTCCCKKFYQI